MGATPILDIRLLGPLEVRADEAPLVVDTRKALAIVALLATDRRPFARDELAALLWPDADDESARGALRRTLSTLRAAVGGRWMQVDRAQVALDDDRLRIDLARAAELTAGGSLDQLAEAAALHRGPFLAGFSLRDAPAFDDWQAARATDVASSLADLLDRLAVARLAAGDGRGALDAARRRVEADPLDESGQRRLIELLGLTGDRAGAIRQYRACVAVLDAELGVPPLDVTTALYERIRDEQTVVALPPAVPAEAPTLPTSETPLVGRDPDLARLVAAHAASAGHGGVAVIEGEAGIGKTRLAEALAREVVRADAAVLGARCYPGEQAVAYAPIIAVLRAGLALRGGTEQLRDLSPVARAELASLLPDLPPNGASRPAESFLAPLEGPAARARLLDAVADGLAALARGPAPGLVWLDDLHWADAATLEAVGYVARRLAGRSMLLVVTWRREDLDGPAAAVAARLERVASPHLRLGRLDPVDVAVLAAAVAPDRAAEPGMLDELIARSEGLPLYVIEALAAGSARGGTSDPDVPPGVRALVAERLATLDGTALQLLGAAAVIGRSFDLATARRASGRNEDEAVDALERLVRRGFLRELRPAQAGEPAFDFAHGSIRELAYGSISFARRRLLHRRVAEGLAGRPVTALADPTAHARLDGPTAASVAGHLLAAGHEAEAALAFAHAAVQARRVHANTEAVAHVESALALAHPEPARLHGMLGDLSTLRGEYTAAIQHYEAAASHLVDDATGLAELDHRLALVHQRRGDSTSADGYFAAALSATPAGAGRALVLADRSLNARDSGALDEAARLAAGALAEAEASGDRDAIARAANVVGVLATERQELAAGRAHLERSLALATEANDPAARIAAMNNLARAVASAGETAGAISLTEAALALCVAIGDRHREAALHNNLADLLRASGRREEALEHLKTAVAIFSDVGDPGALEPGKWRMATW